MHKFVWQESLFGVTLSEGRSPGAPSPAVRDRTMRCELAVPRPALRGSPRDPLLSHELSHWGTTTGDSLVCLGSGSHEGRRQAPICEIGPEPVVHAEYQPAVYQN